MSSLFGIDKYVKAFVVPFFGLTLALYFVYHIFQGDRGLFAWWQLQKQVVRAETTAEHTGNQKLYLQNRVRLLNPGSLDPDMLDERARLMLNYGHRDEVVIIDPERRQ